MHILRFLWLALAALFGFAVDIASYFRPDLLPNIAWLVLKSVALLLFTFLVLIYIFRARRVERRNTSRARDLRTTARRLESYVVNLADNVVVIQDAIKHQLTSVMEVQESLGELSSLTHEAVDQVGDQTGSTE